MNKSIVTLKTKEEEIQLLLQVIKRIGKGEKISMQRLELMLVDKENVNLNNLAE